jgi:Cytidylyltransferase-like
MFITQLIETTQQPRILVVYAGRFQPFHKGHHAVFNWLATKYGRDNVFIATSNKQDHLKSPFSFSEKSYFMNLTGVPGDRIVEAAQPYKPTDLLANYDPATTLLLFAVSEKDMAEDPRFKVGAKKDGSPSYFQHLPAKLTDTKTFNEHAYLVVAPKFDFTVLGQPMDSATDIRKMYPESDEKTRRAIIKDLFGRYTPEAQQIMDSKLGAPEQKNVTVPKVGKMYEEAAGVGLVRGGNDPRYVMATTGDQNDVNSKTLGKMMKAYKLVGQKAPKTGQQAVKKNIAESYEDSVSAVESAIIRRIMAQHTDLLAKFGPKDIMDAAREQAEWVGDVDEIGSSDVSAWVHNVIRELESRQQPTEEGMDSTSPVGGTLEDKLRAELHRQKSGEQLDETEPSKHLVSVTVSDPHSPAVSQRKELKQRRCKVTATDRESAIDAAIKWYRRQGLKVHDHNYIGPADQGMAEETGDAKFDKMMGNITSPESLNTREALAMIQDLVHNAGASYKEALHQASVSFEVSPAKLDKLCREQGLAEDDWHGQGDAWSSGGGGGGDMALGEAGPGPVNTQQMQQALQVVQQFAAITANFAKEQKYQIHEVEMQLRGLEQKWDEMRLGMTGMDVEDAIKEALAMLGQAMSAIYKIDEEVKYTARSIQSSIEDAEQEANWKD